MEISRYFSWSSSIVQSCSVHAFFPFPQQSSRPELILSWRSFILCPTNKMAVFEVRCAGTRAITRIFFRGGYGLWEGRSFAESNSKYCFCTAKKKFREGFAPPNHPSGYVTGSDICSPTRPQSLISEIVRSTLSMYWKEWSSAAHPNWFVVYKAKYFTHRLVRHKSHGRVMSEVGTSIETLT